jgi:hypothetical protein
MAGRHAGEFQSKREKQGLAPRFDDEVLAPPRPSGNRRGAQNRDFPHGAMWVLHEFSLAGEGPTRQ